METKKHLNEYADLVEKIKRSRERLEMINAALENKAIELDGQPKGNQRLNHVEKAVIRLIEAKERLAKQIIMAEDLRQNISDEIEMVPEPTYKELLFSRYILLLTWEGVTDRVSEVRRKKKKSDHFERYSASHVMGPMHGRALRSFENCMKEKETQNENTDRSSYI